MLTLDQILQSHPEVVATTLETGEVVLLHLDSQPYYSLNLTGAHIWEGLTPGLPLRGVSRRLQVAFEVRPERAERSVLTLVEDLLQQRLVEYSGEEPSHATRP
jgi:Coenzyme PQQ synthesis protein D (PqqD)